MMRKIVFAALVASLAAALLRYALEQDDRAALEEKLTAEFDSLRAHLFNR